MLLCLHTPPDKEPERHINLAAAKRCISPLLRHRLLGLYVRWDNHPSRQPLRLSEHQSH